MKVISEARILMVLLYPILFVAVSHGQVKDVEGNIYKSVKIGKQFWLTENLKTSRFRNGDVIPEAKTQQEWSEAGENKKSVWCYYNFDANLGKKYGKLYNWYAAIDPRGLAPKGWHVPTVLEWDQLGQSLGGDSIAGFKLKTASGWHSNIKFPKGDGSNESGFNGLPSGHLSGMFGFSYLEYFGEYWTATEKDSETAWMVFFGFSNKALQKQNDTKTVGFAIRCIKD